MIINNTFFKNYFELHGETSIAIFDKYSFFRRIVASFLRFFNIPFNINPLINTLNDNSIIYFDACIKNSKSLLKLIAQKNKGKKLIFYYWNPVNNSTSLKDIPSDFEIWSYSPVDCKKYNLHYNPTFYFSDIIKEIQISKDNECDILFVGKDKGRYAEIIKFNHEFQNLGLKTNFHIVKDHPWQITKKLSRPLPYKEILNLISKNKAIFDYYKNPQAGLSLRAMEALFFEKKLITNNQDICNYDFFNSGNIFILGQRTLDELTDFLAAPYITVPSAIKEKYLFENWIKRFL